MTEEKHSGEIPIETPEDDLKENLASEAEKPEEAEKEAEKAPQPEETAPEEKKEEDSSGEDAGENKEDASGESAGENEEGESGETDTEKMGFFAKKKNKETEKLKGQIDELNDRLKRSMAEFDNFRKRTEKEKAGMYVIGAKDIVEKILPVVDNFERALAQAPEGDAFADGMKMIYKQMMTILTELGVEPIKAVGEVFDPALHNAVMHVEDDSVGENIIVEEFQKGYRYKDFVVRHSMVKVAN